MSTVEEEGNISFPSIAIVAVLGYLIYRYFIAKPSAASNGSPARNGLRFTPAQVDQIAQMFPQLNRRDIMWDLQRNGGSVQATTERALQGRGLDPVRAFPLHVGDMAKRSQAPPTFQPSIPANSFASIQSAIVTNKSSKSEPDLITRYNLQSRIASIKGKEKEEELASGWSSTKEQRQATLQKRRDEMILAARRKMQEKDLQAGLSSS